MIRPNYKLLLLLLPLLAIYFLSRLQNLTQIPVFGDEAIYIRWAQLIKNVDTLRFVPLSDGKQPLFMWLNSITLRFFSDPLVAGRIISVFAGAGILTLLFTFALFFFNPTSAVLISLIYVFTPFSFFFDRMSLADNLLSFFGVLSLLISILLAKYPRLDLSLILGMVLGLAWLTKSPAIYFIALSVITYFFLNPKNIKKLWPPAIFTFISFLIYNILRLGPQFQQIALRNQDYIWSLQEIIKHPFDPLIPHLLDVVHIYYSYISLPILIAFVFSMLLFYRHLKTKIVLVLLGWWLSPLVANAFIAKVFTARYILFTLPPFILLIGYFLSLLLNKIKLSPILKLLSIFLLLTINIFTIQQLSINSFNFSLPSTESGYTSDWTSGWGIKAAADYLISRSYSSNVIVGTEGYFGTLPDGLQIYTDGLPNITVIGVGVDITKIPPQLIDAFNHGDEVYLLMNSSRLKLTPDQEKLIVPIKSYPKPGNDSLVLSKVIAKLE